LSQPSVSLQPLTKLPAYKQSIEHTSMRASRTWLTMQTRGVDQERGARVSEAYHVIFSRFWSNFDEVWRSTARCSSCVTPSLCPGMPEKLEERGAKVRIR